MKNSTKNQAAKFLGTFFLNDLRKLLFLILTTGCVTRIDPVTDVAEQLSVTSFKIQPTQINLPITSNSINSQEFVLSSAIADMFVKDFINKISEEAKKILDEATRNGDYLLEKNLSRLDLIIQNMMYQFSKDLDKKIKDLGKEEQKFMNDLNQLVDNGINTTAQKFLEVEQFFVLDVNDLLNRVNLPIIRKNYYIARIDGIGQSFKTRGFYRVVFIGNAFKQEIIDSLFIDGKYFFEGIDKANNKISVDIPINSLNKYYQDTTISRKSIEIRSYKEKETVWYNPFTWFDNNYEKLSSYRGNLLLLPKYPVNNYTLSETVDINDWSEEEYDSERGHTMLGQSPGNKDWITGTIITSVPQDCLIIRDKLTTSAPEVGGWVFFRNFMFTGDNKVIAEVGSQWEDRSVNFYLSCKYKKPLKKTIENRVFLESKNQKCEKLLKYGDYTCKLSKGYGGFIMNVELFNGEEITLIPSESRKKGISIRVENLGENLTRLFASINQE